MLCSADNNDYDDNGNLFKEGMCSHLRVNQLMDTPTVYSRHSNGVNKRLSDDMLSTTRYTCTVANTFKPLLQS